MGVKSKKIQSCFVFSIILGLIFSSCALFKSPVNSGLEESSFPHTSVIPIEIPEDLVEKGITTPTQFPNARFMENKGQLDNNDCQYYLNVGEMTVYFGTSKIYFAKISQQDDSEEINISTYSMEFLGGANINPVGISENSYSVNYILGAGSWTDVPSFNAIVYSSIYPGIDLKYFLTDEGLKYEFLVHAGANPNLIVITINGAGPLSVHPTEVVSEGLFSDSGLVVYQADGVIIDATFVPTTIGSGSSYAFKLERYVSTQDLIIDPLIIDFSTYLGGSQNEGESTYIEDGLFVDSSGYIYLAGRTLSTNFPMLNNLSGYVGSWDLFITKMNQDASAIIYSTYIGGSGDEFVGGGIQVDIQGNAYVAGSTRSINFPTVNPYQTDPDGTILDIFVFKLNSTGNGLNYSTYIGGTNKDEAWDLTIDTDGNAYVTGGSYSTDYPLKNQYQGTEVCGAVYLGAVLTKLNATGNGLIFSTCFGGTTTSDYGLTLEIDAFRNVYIAGEFQVYGTASDFPLKNAWDNTATLNYVEGFIACLNSTGNGLNFSTYIGGSLNDAIREIRLGSDGGIYAVGYTTSSTDFPLVNAYQGSYGGGTYDAIVLKLNATGNGANFSTYFGGNGVDLGCELALTPEEEIAIAGVTTSTNFAPVQAYQASYQGGQDSFVSIFTTNCSSVKFSSYLGGTDFEHTWDLWVDDQNCTYIIGETASSNFPTRHAYQGDQGGKDMFLTKLFLDEAPVISTPSNFDFSEFTSGNQINWTITDSVAKQGNYTVFKNGSVWETYENLLWNPGVELHVTVDGLIKGIYNFTILADDGYGLTASDEVIVNVTGNSPTITGSNDFSYYADTTGHQINWTVIDSSVGPLANYSVFRNGSVWSTYENLSWISEVEFQVYVDGLAVGVHNFTIRAFDGTGLNATDAVFVTVLKRTTNGTWQDIILGNQFITCFEMEVTFAEVFIQGVATGSHIKITAYASNPTTTALKNGVRFFGIELDNAASVSFPVTVKFYYDESQLPQGVSEGSLGIYHLVNGKWILQGGSINTDLNTITLICNSFSEFAIGQITDMGLPFDPALLTWLIPIVVAILVAYGCIKFRKGKGSNNAVPGGIPELDFDP